MRFRWIALGAALSSLAILSAPAQADTLMASDYSIPARYSLMPCSNGSQLDCIESIKITSSDGSEAVAEFAGFDTNTYFAGMDSRGNFQQGGTEIWRYGQGKANRQISIEPWINSPTFACCEVDKRLKRFGSIRTRISGLGDGQIMQLILRTSWIRPLNLAISAKHASIKDEVITGGRKWTLKFENSLVFDYQTTSSGSFESKIAGGFVLPADILTDDIHFVLDHAGVSDELSPYPINCSENGYTAEASNSSSAGQPFWNGKQLEFAVFAPHLTTSGEVNHGFFQFWASTAYMDCKWPGNNLSHSTSFTVSVVEADGVQKIETAGANIKDGMFHLWVDDFHYSSPTIKVQAVQTDPAPTPIASPTQISTPTPTPKQSTSASRQTIKCRQIAKPHKLVTLNAPKKTCPKGYNKTNW